MEEKETQNSIYETQTHHIVTKLEHQAWDPQMGYLYYATSIQNVFAYLQNQSFIENWAFFLHGRSGPDERCINWIIPNVLFAVQSDSVFCSTNFPAAFNLPTVLGLCNL